MTEPARHARHWIVGRRRGSLLQKLGDRQAPAGAKWGVERVGIACA